MDKSKSDWHLKTKPEKCLLSTLIVVLILLIGSLIFIVMKLTITINTSCDTPICISTANDILNSIDPTANPCDDFFQFSCGNFIKQHGTTYYKSKDLKEYIKKQLEKLMKEPLHENDHYLVKNQKILFQSCMNKTENKEDNLNYFTNLVKELNGWPVLEGENWNDTLWEEICYKLRTKGLHYVSFLDIKVASDPLNITNNIVHISDPFTLLLKDKDKEIYLKYIKDSVMYLGADKATAERDVPEMYNFIKTLSNISGKNDYNSENITEEIVLRRMTVKDFQKHNNQINWLNFINKLLEPAASITENDYVIFPAQKYIEAFFDLMNTTRNRVKVNCIFWTLFDSFTHYFPKDLEYLDVSYRCSKDGYFNKIETLEWCQSLLRRSFEFIPTDMIYVQRVLTNERKNAVSNMVKYVKSEFHKILSETPWMDNQSKENALKKLRGIIEVVGAKNHLEDPVVKLFENRTLDKNDTSMMLYIKSRKLLMDMHYSQLLFSDDYNKFRIINNDANSINAYYVTDRNVIALFTGILQNQFFNPKKSQYLNYGNLGTIVGHELTHAFCQLSNEYYELGDKEFMWTDDSSEALKNATQCVLEEAKNFVIKDTDRKINASSTLEENIADFVGVKVAYRAYKRWVEENGEELPLVGVNYTPYQLFWVSTALRYCYEVEKDDLHHVIKYDPHAINVFRVNAPLKNNPDFAKDFSCPVGSPMNPSKKCNVF